MDDDKPRVPRREGRQDADSVDGDSRPFKALSLPATATLNDLANEYVFFNHGALFTYGEMRVDPAQEYCVENKCEVQLLVTPKPVFRGVSNGKKEFQHWDHSLLAVPTDHWLGISRMLIESGILDLANQKFHKAYYKPVKIVDWISVEQHTAMDAWPTLRVALFGLDGNKQFIKVTDSDIGGADKKPSAPRLVIRPPNPEAVSFADAIFGDHPRPYDVIDPKRNGRHS